MVLFKPCNIFFNVATSNCGRLTHDGKTLSWPANQSTWNQMICPLSNPYRDFQQIPTSLRRPKALLMQKSPQMFWHSILKSFSGGQLGWGGGAMRKWGCLTKTQIEVRGREKVRTLREPKQRKRVNQRCNRRRVRRGHPKMIWNLQWLEAPRGWGEFRQSFRWRRGLWGWVHHGSCSTSYGTGWEKGRWWWPPRPLWWRPGGARHSSRDWGREQIDDMGVLIKLDSEAPPEEGSYNITTKMDFFNETVFLVCFKLTPKRVSKIEAIFGLIFLFAELVLATNVLIETLYSVFACTYKNWFDFLQPNELQTGFDVCFWDAEEPQFWEDGSETLGWRRFKVHVRTWTLRLP